MHLEHEQKPRPLGRGGVTQKMVKSLVSFEKDSSGMEDGVLTITGWAYRSYDDFNNPVIDRDGEHIDFDSFSLEASVLLMYHDHSRPVGKVEMTKATQGIKFVAKVYRDLDPQGFFAVKAGVINAVSVGFIPTSMKYITVQGEDIVSFTSGSVIELSLVTVPSNPLAIIDSVKSVIKDGKCEGLACSVKAMKEMNPDCGCDLEKLKQGVYEGEKMKEEVVEKQEVETPIEAPVEPVVEQTPVEPTPEPVEEEKPSETPVEPSEPKQEEQPKEDVLDTKEEEQPISTESKPVQSEEPKNIAPATYGEVITQFENLGLSSLDVLPPDAIEHLYNLSQALGIQSITDKIEAAISAAITSKEGE